MIIHDDDPPIPTRECAYQVQVGYSPDTYRCYTQQEWDAKQVADAKTSAESWRAFKHDAGLMASWLWGWPIIGFIVSLVIINRIRAAWRKRHPRQPWELL